MLWLGKKTVYSFTTQNETLCLKLDSHTRLVFPIFEYTGMMTCSWRIPENYIETKLFMNVFKTKQNNSTLRWKPCGFLNEYFHSRWDSENVSAANETTIPDPFLASKINAVHSKMSYNLKKVIKRYNEAFIVKWKSLGNSFRRRIGTEQLYTHKTPYLVWGRE